MPVEVADHDQKRTVVGLVDTGADETVISAQLAEEISVEQYGTYEAVCASGFLLKGRYADVRITELRTGKNCLRKVGVSDVPFHTDDLDEEGLQIILGIDFLQETGLEIKSK